MGKNILQFISNILVFETENMQALRFEISCPFPIIFDLVGLVVNAAVQLNGQLGLHAEEIEHVGAEGVLPAEF